LYIVQITAAHFSAILPGMELNIAAGPDHSEELHQPARGLEGRARILGVFAQPLEKVE
jgi:hypothetical protein